MVGQHVVEHGHVAMVGETEVAYAACLALFQKVVEHAVVDIAGVELLHAATHAHAVKEQVVDVVDLQLLERVVVHPERRLAGPGRRREIRQFGGYEVLVAGMPFQRYPRGPFRAPYAVGGRCVEIVYSVGYGVVNQRVDGFLVKIGGGIAPRAASHVEPAHASVSQERHLVAGRWVDAVGHAVGGDFRLRHDGLRGLPVVGSASGQGGCRSSRRPRSEAF